MFGHRKGSEDGFRYINRRYAAALLVTAALLLISQVIIQATIINMKSDARVVNLSGRQRMLSQRITKTALGAAQAATREERKAYLDELEMSRNIWQKTHAGLRYGSRELDLPGDNSDSVNALYQKMEPHYEAMINAVGAILVIGQTNGDAGALKPLVRQIRENEQFFLQYMDRIVFQYDHESNTKLLILQVLELSILAIALVVLVFEWRIVFRPAQKEITEGFDALRRNEAHLNQLFETSPSITILFDSESLRAVKYNEMAVQLLHQWVGIDLTDETSFADVFPGDNDADLNRRLLEKIHAEGEFSNLEVGLTPERMVLLSAKTVESHGQAFFLVGLSDITTIKQMATVDSMTNMLNRRAGLELLAFLFDENARRRVSLSVCFVDIDGLKPVNDTFGHQEGDFYIRMVAQAVNEVMGNQYKSIRYGGDEILIVAESSDIDDFRERMALAEKRLEALRREHFKSYHMSISYGFASYPDGSSQSWSELVEEADFNMYEQKKQKRTIRQSAAAERR